MSGPGRCLRLAVALVLLIAFGCSERPPEAATPGADEQPDHIVDLVAEGLGIPFSMTLFDDATILVADRATPTLWRVVLSDGTKSRIDGLPDIVTGDDAGLHGIHWDRHAGHLYLIYSAACEGGSTTALDRARIAGERLTDVVRLITTQACATDRYHYGGVLALREGYLFLAVGDRHERARAQDLGTHAGKILRLRMDGTIPDDNPFVDVPGALPEIWTLGHRNPNGLAFQPSTGELWSSEHGPFGGDEINHILPGRNYGWPVISWGWEYEGGPIGGGLPHAEGYEQPIKVFTPAIAPFGLMFYEGDEFARWRGSVFIAARSRLHLNRTMFRDHEVVLEERLFFEPGALPRSVIADAGGHILVATDQGRLLRLRRPERNRGAS